MVFIVGAYGVNSSINTYSDYHHSNNNGNKLSAIPSVLIANADEEISNGINNNSSSNDGKKDTSSYIGVNMRGLYTSLQYERYHSTPIPLLTDYYNKSLRLISEAGMNHIRYVFYWEAFEKNPQMFMNELDIVANYADKWRLNVLYDNHQYHTSSWLDPKNGTGFPESLFRGNIDGSLIYRKGSGGETKDDAARVWWNKWWDRTIKDTEGNDGWSLQANFLKRIIIEVDEHPSTLGYEILNEPQIHNDNQWFKVGIYNTFMVDELREITEKTIAYSQQIPTSLENSAISMTPKI